MSGTALFIFEWPTLPLENEPVLLFTVALVAFLVGPLVIERLGQPGIVGIVLLGAAVGPGGAGLLEAGEAIVLLGNAGLVYLLFTVGLELDLRGFLAEPESAAIFGLASFLLPFVVGTAAGMAVLGFDIWAALLLAAVFASHTLLAYPLLDKFGITQNEAVTAVFGGILFTDTLALIVLALVVGAFEAGLSTVLVADVTISLAVLFATVWLVVTWLAKWFFKTFSQESYFEFLFVMVAFFLSASLAELLGIAPILGAFVAGIALNRLVPPGGTLMTRIEFVGNALFIPFFLFYVGLLVDLRAIAEEFRVLGANVASGGAAVLADPAALFAGVRTLEIAVVIVAVMFLTKWLAVQLVGRVQGYDANERGVMFGLSTGQAAAALAVTLIGADAGVFGDQGEAVLNAVVVLLLVTAVASPWLTRRASNRVALARDPGEDAGEVTDPRILLPLSHHAERQRRLLELAFLLKSEEPTEPVHALTVVSPTDPDGTETRVAETQEQLDDLVAVGHEADVTVETATRVNHNPASGIVNGAYEEQADMVLMGWDADRPLQQRMFGSVIDRVLERTRVPVLVAHLGYPVNTTERMFVVVPHGIDTHAGFFEGLYFLKQLAHRTDADLELLLVGGSADQYERLFDLVEPELTATFTELDGWSPLVAYLREHATDDDLTTVLSPRRGRVGWHDRLRTLPRTLAGLPAESFIVVTLREDDPEHDRQFLRYR